MLSVAGACDCSLSGDGTVPAADTEAMSGSDEEKEPTIDQVVERLAGRFPDADRGLIAGIV
ncbi:hypothetical protein QFZ23_003866 [Arthrobacter globiformis]|nr:hypothetical protein [Arthrobacter globiformis]